MFSAATLAVLISAGSLAPWATGESNPEDLVITLVTFSPGDSLTEFWGHTSVVVEDKKRGEARLYNYGMFGFDEGFVHRFVQGRLEFWVADDPVMPTFEFYKRQLNRDVRLQELNLTPDEAAVVAKALGDNVRPENRTYLYHHYNDNCSTRPRDIIDRALKGQILTATNKPARASLRVHTRRYSMVSPVMSIVLDYLQNDELERPITMQNEAFLPDELERQFDSLTVTHSDGSVTPLVRKKTIWFQSNRTPPPEVPPNWIPQLFGLGLAFAALALLLGHLGKNGSIGPRIALGMMLALEGLVGGAFGLFLFIVGLFTNHTVAHRNENLFCFGPLHIALLPLGLMFAFGSKRAPNGLRWVTLFCGVLAVLGVLVKVLPAFNQANWNLIAMTLPVNVGLAVLFTLDARQRRALAP